MASSEQNENPLLPEVKDLPTERLKLLLREFRADLTGVRLAISPSPSEELVLEKAIKSVEEELARRGAGGGGL